ncbi:MAG TPA: hydrogenase accessory protein HypB [Planctomycetes bacterium]|nr:hydrogenase accessory protein HypB [Planctomycetota bacterium]
MKVRIVQSILADNARLAARNRELFASRRVLCVNMMSSPGAGKTTILEKTLPYLKERHGLAAAVIEGDIEGSEDGRRIERLGVPVVQLNTRGACHLDASMVARALEDLPAEGLDLIIIENVGNLVCPAEFDLGEDLRAVVLSVPEGDDKPSKYPAIFRKADVLLINKIDLVHHVQFSRDRVRAVSRRLAPRVEIMELAAATGEGVAGFGDHLATAARAKKEAR